MRVHTGEAGADRRGLWVDDKYTGTRIRLGEVGYEIAADMTLAGHSRAARETMGKPRAGFWFSRIF